MKATNSVLEAFAAEIVAKSSDIHGKLSKIIGYCYNKSNYILAFEGADMQSFSDFSAYFAAQGFTLKEASSTAKHAYLAAQGRDGITLFLNYYEALGELHFALETDSHYFDLTDTVASDLDLPPQITQIHLEDFGMSYAIRLTDGSSSSSTAARSSKATPTVSMPACGRALPSRTFALRHGL